MRSVESRYTARRSAGHASHHRAQVLALLFDGSVHAPSELKLACLEFGSQAFGTREPQDQEFALPGCPAAVREPEEILLVNSVEYPDRGAQDKLVLQRGQGQRPFAVC